MMVVVMRARRLEIGLELFLLLRRQDVFKLLEDLRRRLRTARRILAE